MADPEVLSAAMAISWGFVCYFCQEHMAFDQHQQKQEKHLPNTKMGQKQTKAYNLRQEWVWYVSIRGFDMPFNVVSC